MLRIIPRAEWGATAPLGPPMRLPVDELWLHHSVTPQTADPLADMRTIERVGVQRFGRFSYSWAYHRPSRSLLEGAGNTVGAHTAGRNSTSLGLVLIGNFELLELDDVGVADVREAIDWLIAGNRLRPGVYPTGGHRDLKQTACPGGNAYARIPDIRATAPEEDDDDMAEIIWMKQIHDTPTAPAGTPHAYRVAGVVGKHLTWEAYQESKDRGDPEPVAPEVGSPQVPAGTNVQGLYDLVDGPCRNRPIDSVTITADTDEEELAQLLGPLLEARIDALPDAEVDRIARKVADEQARRLAG